MEAALFITICTMTVIAAITAGLWARNRSARTMVAGIGLMVLPLGLYLTGLMTLAYNGVISIIDWAQRTVWGTTMSWGAGLLGLGVVLLVTAAFLKSRPRAPRKPKDAAGSAPAAGTNRVAVGAAGAPPASPAPQSKPAGKKGGVDPEDAEIEALLRKRGIM